MVRTVAVAAVACALASCGPATTATTTAPGHHDDPNAPRREAYVISETPGIAITATDAHYLYWIDTAGLWRRPHGDADVKAELMNKALAGYADGAGGAMLVVADRAYILRNPKVSSVSVVKKDEKPEDIVEMPTEIDAFTIAEDGSVYIASAGQVLEAATGKVPKVLATGQGAIDDVIVDAKYVYVATDTANGLAPSAPAPYYGAPVPDVPKTHAIRKVPRDGGKVIDLATDQSNAGTLGLAGDRVWWVSGDGTAVSSVPTDGGEVRSEAMGRADTLAVDAVGLVYHQNNENGDAGMIVERRGEALQVDWVADGTFYQADRIVLGADWVYVTAARMASGGRALLALPRQAQPVQVAFALDRMFQMLQIDDDVLYWSEISRAYDGHLHIMRGDRLTGGRKELADYEGSIMGMAVGGGQLYFHDGYTISQVSTSGGEVRTFDRTDSSWVAGLTVHRNHVYWFDGTSLYARKRRGGVPFTVARNDNYYGYGYYGDGGGDLVFDDDFVYTTGFGQGGTGVYQISERGQIKMLWDGAGSTYPGKDLVILGDELFFTAGQGGPVTVMRVTSDGVAEPIYHARGDGYGTDLIEGGGMLYLMAITNGSIEVTRIDPSSGEGQVVFRIYNSYGGSGGQPALAADSYGVYLGLEPYDAIFRIAHDAPAVPDVGWPADAE